MRCVDLLLSNSANDSLAVVAEKICGLLSATDFEERESENYHGGEYFRARTSFAEIKVMHFEDPDHPDLPIWLELSPSRNAPRDASFDVNFVDQLVRSQLLSAGFKVALVEDIGQWTEKRKDY